jgi:hypothetical protein
MNRFKDDVEGIPVAWQRLEGVLAERDPKLLATLQAPLASVAEIYQTTTKVWFSQHDGQRPRSRPLYRGFRLLSYAEGEKRWDRIRGPGYRSDWVDSWSVLAQCGAHRLLCYDDVVTSVFEVDVSKGPYTKQRICFGMAKWLDLAARAVT